MDAAAVAQEFINWLNHKWHHDPDEPGPLYGFFVDWAEHSDLMGRCAGDRAVALEAFVIAYGRFEANPEEFGRCAPFIRGLVHGNDSAMSFRPGAAPTWRGYLEAEEWQRELFRRQCGDWRRED